MAGIFISYRRSDSDIAAGRLSDDLSGIFGRGSIFRDVDTLEPGEEYENALDHALNSCAALIAVIGPRWSTITDDNGRRRLEDSNDWVRIEISRALTRRIRVIPLLIGATVPQEGDLPTELKPLVKRHAFEISDRHWRQDLELLTQALEKIPGIARRISADQTTPLTNPPLQASMVERTIRVPDQAPVRPSSGSRVVAAAVSAVVLTGGAEWYLEVEKLVKSNKTWSWDWLFAP